MTILTAVITMLQAGYLYTRASNWFRVVGDAHFESFIFLPYDNIVNTVSAVCTNTECRIYYFVIYYSVKRREKRGVGIFIIQAVTHHYTEIVLYLFL